MEFSFNSAMLLGFNSLGTAIGGPPPACFAGGTMIETDAGLVAIEALKVGDLLVTHTGVSAPLRWIGRREVDLTISKGRMKAVPIRVKAGALADGVPFQDLYVSPEHALLVDGCLVPALRLVNGSSIVQQAELDTVTYYHLECDSHLVLTANGALAESYLDIGYQAFPDRPMRAPMTVSEMRTHQVAPFASANLMTAIRQRILARAEASTAAGYDDAAPLGEGAAA